jgi:hypothetical protein
MGHWLSIGDCFLFLEKDAREDEFTDQRKGAKAQSREEKSPLHLGAFAPLR